jgi:hypothetical protein
LLDETLMTRWFLLSLMALGIVIFAFHKVLNSEAIDLVPSAASPPLPFSEEIILVKSLPNVSALAVGTGAYIDLGYLHTAKGGEWVGRIDRRNYVKLSPSRLSQVMAIGNMRELPEPPALSTAGSLKNIWLFAMTLLVVMAGAIIIFTRFLPHRSTIDDEIAALAASLNKP